MRPHRRQPTRPHRPWDSPGKNTGVGCHFLLQCRKVKSESEVIQSCPTLSHLMDCSLPGSSIHGIFQARVLECVAIAFSTASVRCITFLSFIKPIFAWNVPLVSLIFLKRSLVFPILLFSLFLCIDRWGRLSYLFLLFFGTLHSDAYIFPFLLCFLLLFFSQLFLRPLQTTILLFCISFPFLMQFYHFL